jgi:hypothetical protein
MKKTILSGGAGTAYLAVAGHDDPVEIQLDEVSVILHDDTTEIRNDFLRQPIQLKIGDRKATIRARVTALVDGEPVWNLFGLEQKTGIVARKRYQEKLTIPSQSPYTLTLSPEAGYDIDYNALVVIDYDGDTPSGAQYDRVSGSPAAGEYAVDEDDDTLTFSLADAGKTVLVRYLETKSGIYYAYGEGYRRCVRIEAAFPVLNEFGCPGALSNYLAVVVPRAVPVSDYQITGSREATTLDMEFVALADPDGEAIFISPLSE